MVATRNTRLGILGNRTLLLTTTAQRTLELFFKINETLLELRGKRWKFKSFSSIKSQVLLLGKYPLIFGHFLWLSVPKIIFSPSVPEVEFWQTVEQQASESRR